ncbi:hypothetical protein B0I35DRAFT_407045 [Stachybotrys elegans]|uniref:Uncharacterized protein n=1 Tax=Stachybotrys elegans TaxID=80388 RepID=A0A8K0WT93_9HYPO|nr:hypothetical protein B0I35DRAFT_407045 [Stachybotrys elegans]
MAATTTARTGARFRSYATKSSAFANDAADELSPDEIRLSSHRVPTLAAGTYTVRIEQSIAAPDGQTDTLSTEQQFVVEAPQLRLDSNVDVHSVFPAPGHGAPANTLPHIVFNDPELPWERSISNTSPDSFNRIPWTALLTFTEEELHLPPEDLTKWQGDKPRQSPTLAVSMKAGILRLQGDAATMVSPVSGIEPKFKDSKMVECLVLSTDLFKRLFGSYPAGAKESTWSGKPDLGAFSYLAHVRGVHPHAMASTSLGDTELQVSVLMGHRVAPFGLQRPTMMMSHVVSLEGVEKLTWSDGGPRYVGLVSLHSWSWMALPPDHLDFVDVMGNLARSTHPLRMADTLLNSSALAAKQGALDENAAWLLARLKDGYLLKPHTSLSGSSSTVLFRGPLTPTLPVLTAASVKAWSSTGNDLEVRDCRTGLVDVSYRAAWQLGRLLAVADASLNTSLLRLRGRIHTETSRQVRQENDPDFVKMSVFTANLSSAVSYIVEANQANKIRVGNANATLRWCNGWFRPENVDASATTSVDDVASTQQFYDTVIKVVSSLTRARGEGGKAAYNEENDPVSHDWANVLGWIMNLLFTDKIPLYYQVSTIVRNPWQTKDGARQIYVPSPISAPPARTTTSKQPAASAPQTTTTKASLPHVELPVGHRPRAKEAWGSSYTPKPLKMVKDLPCFDYWPYYDGELIYYGGTSLPYADYFKPTVDCFPLHLGRGSEVLLQPYIDAPMDVVFTANGHTGSNFMPFNVDFIEWLIPVHVSDSAPLDKSLEPNPDEQPPLFTIGGTLDHPSLPSAEPINIGCRWLYDTRLVHGTLLDFPLDEYKHKAVPKPDTNNLHALLIVRARSRDNPWREPECPDKYIDAGFLLKDARWHVPDGANRDRAIPNMQFQTAPSESWHCRRQDSEVKEPAPKGGFVKHL